MYIPFQICYYCDMVFSSSIFLFGFLGILLLLYFNPCFSSRKFRNVLLLLASLLFYAWGEPVFVFIMIASICINFYLVKIMERAVRKKQVLTLCVVWNVGLLFVFKYLGFFIKNLKLIFNLQSIPFVEIALPIGISFFTFQILSYAFDVYYKKAQVQNNILDLSLYIVLFPQLIAGPIVRYETIADQIQNRQETFENFSLGLRRFVVGLAKKCLLADSIVLVANYIYDFPQTTQCGAILWLGAIAYTFQIYFDFSGYSDMAIGLGRMFGFKFEENFNYPYIASSITDFWRRWHISLSSWFRDYVYIPLGGNRVKPARHILNLFVVWVLTGLWHGAAWHFVFWGLYYFVLLILEKKLLSKINSCQFLRIVWRVMTLIFIVVGWTIFEAPLSVALARILRMFNPTDFFGDGYYLKETLKNSLPIFIICTLASLPMSKLKIADNKMFCVAKNVFAVALFALCVCKILGDSYSPFIYFNF